MTGRSYVLRLSPEELSALQRSVWFLLNASNKAGIEMGQPTLFRLHERLTEVRSKCSTCGQRQARKDTLCSKCFEIERRNVGSG